MNHASRYLTAAVLALPLVLSSGCSHKKCKIVNGEAYAKGQNDAAQFFAREIEKLQKESADMQLKNKLLTRQLAELNQKPRDKAGRFIKVNGQTVDLDGK